MSILNIECNKCGICCELASQIPELSDYIIDGKCKYFVNNECLIYENRPDICNTTKMYEKKYKPSGMTKQNYINMCKECCEKLKEQREFILKDIDFNKELLNRSLRDEDFRQDYITKIITRSEKAIKLAVAIFDYDQELRRRYKYTDDETIDIREARELLNEFLSERNVSIYDIDEW